MAEPGGKTDVAKREEEILAFWKDRKIFEKTIEKDAPKGEFDGTWEVREFRRDGVELPPLVTDGARWRIQGSPGGRGGMEYWGDAAESYRGTYDIRTKDTEESWAELIHLFKVLNETPANRLEAGTGTTQEGGSQAHRRGVPEAGARRHR